jgi:hypothetical protein
MIVWIEEVVAPSLMVYYSGVMLLLYCSLQISSHLVDFIIEY